MAKKEFLNLMEIYRYIAPDEKGVTRFYVLLAPSGAQPNKEKLGRLVSNLPSEAKQYLGTRDQFELDYPESLI